MTKCESYSFPATDRSQFTCGDWKAEADSAAEFDLVMNRTGLFKIHPEVSGQILHPRLGAAYQSVRIDRILQPTPKLREAGWNAGFIGVELKRSGAKIGPPLAQLLDYSRTVWTLHGGFDVMCRYYFLWPTNINIS